MRPARGYNAAHERQEKWRFVWKLDFYLIFPYLIGNSKFNFDYFLHEARVIFFRVSCGLKSQFYFDTPVLEYETRFRVESYNLVGLYAPEYSTMWRHA